MGPEKVIVKVKKLCADARVPTFGSEYAAGFDFYSCEDLIVYPRDTVKIHTGIAMEIPFGKALFIWDRSGMGARGYHRHSGLIDSDYRGEILIALHNTTSKNFEVKKGDRIAQGVIQDYYKAEFVEVDVLSGSERGGEGFGSTGR